MHACVCRRVCQRVCCASLRQRARACRGGARTVWRRLRGEGWRYLADAAALQAEALALLPAHLEQHLVPDVVRTQRVHRGRGSRRHRRPHGDGVGRLRAPVWRASGHVGRGGQVGWGGRGGRRRLARSLSGRAPARALRALARPHQAEEEGCMREGGEGGGGGVTKQAARGARVQPATRTRGAIPVAAEWSPIAPRLCTQFVRLKENHEHGGRQSRQSYFSLWPSPRLSPRWARRACAGWTPSARHRRSRAWMAGPGHAWRRRVARGALPWRRRSR